jgi:hypothetical protein
MQLRKEKVLELLRSKGWKHLEVSLDDLDQLMDIAEECKPSEPEITLRIKTLLVQQNIVTVNQFERILKSSNAK